MVIGNGSPVQAGFFAEDQHLEGSVFTDPERVTYRALGMREGLRSALKLRLLKNTARAYAKGFRQTRVEGDPLQQGGVLVVDGTGRITFSYISETAGDHPTLEAVLTALDALGR